MPIGDIVGFIVVGQKLILFLFLEDHQWQTPCCAMHPPPGYLKIPLPRLLAQVLKVMELPAFEEALSGIWNLSLHFWFVLGMPRPCRVGDEAAVLGILQKASGQSRIKRVRTYHGSWEIVQYQVTWYAPEECPGRLQPLDDVGKLLAKGWPLKLVAGVAQHNYHSPDLALSPTLWVPHQPKATEIRLSYFPGLSICHAHCSM